jgi:hypothetical protein
VEVRVAACAASGTAASSTSASSRGRKRRIDGVGC